MRCPHCAGEILDGSRFCGICGRRLATADVVGPGASSPAPDAGGGHRPGSAGQPRPGPSPSAPRPAVEASRRRAPGPPPDRAATHAVRRRPSSGASWGRIAAILLLDLVLAGAGGFMILSYVEDCEHDGRAAAGPAEVGTGTPAGAGAARGGEATP